MTWLSWPVTLAALALIPLLVIPARLTGRRLQRLTREAIQLDAEMGAAMTERYNVAGAMRAAGRRVVGGHLGEHAKLW
jgi:ATP-binding cassette, subfamily B, bacterial